jgi:hypothetical protein
LTSGFDFGWLIGMVNSRRVAMRALMGAEGNWLLLAAHCAGNRNRLLLTAPLRSSPMPSTAS